jgi:cellulose synthase operon protein B
VLSLDRTGGATLQNHIIHMPLTAFRPGRNRVEIEAQLPSKSDQECDTLASIGAKERFLMLGTSTLILPRLARIAQFPALSASFVGGFRITQSEAPELVLPHATPAILAAAATMIANAAVETGQPISPRVTRERPKGEGAPALVIAPAADLTDPMLLAGGIDPKVLARAWPAGKPARSSDTTGAISGSARPAEPTDAGDRDAERLDAWGEHVDSDGGFYGPASTALAWLGGVLTITLRAAGILSAPVDRVSITADTSFVMAQGMLDGTALTLVTAPDETALMNGAAMITEPAFVYRLTGRAASLGDADEGVDVVSAAETRFFPTQPFSMENTRLIAAGWLSNHASWYIGAVLLMVALLGGSTYASLRLSRRP